MKLTKEQKEAIEESSKKAVICNYEERDYPNMICFKKDMIIALNLIEKLQKENKKYKQFFDLMLRLDSDYFMNCGDEETNKLVDEILKLESE